MPKVINHEHPESVKLRSKLGKYRFNGALYYSEEITKYFIPTVKTDRVWVTIRAGEAFADHSIVFVHDVFYSLEKYEYTFKYDDVVYVVSMPDMVDIYKEHGKVIYLPLSVDVPYVEQFKREKDRDTAFCGRDEWRTGFRNKKPVEFPPGTDFLENIPREQLLSEMARYRNVYATCRTAIEAKVLGCNVLPYHFRFPDTGQWQIYDSRDAARDFQRLLDEADGLA